MIKEKIQELIKELNRCAKQNEKDAQWPCSDIQAWAIAHEQRRMIKILKKLIQCP